MLRSQNYVEILLPRVFTYIGVVFAPFDKKYLMHWIYAQILSQCRSHAVVGSTHYKKKGCINLTYEILLRNPLCHILMTDSRDSWFRPRCLDTSRRLDSQWNSHWKWQKIQGLLLPSSASNVLHKLLKGDGPPCCFFIHAHDRWCLFTVRI